ncbi:Vgb family protein [Paracraurococcus lichenis]|uniref:SMP-30/Gluconolactonase/LRE-like region domain-containing protein n=1 Tax=Paracraurococcus lichenis TaxID=3064888 RepID=A0ABT9ECX4_9PROT|nr:hypothetical protein [Paracraurococcus sp. LOR1-02]MDO9714061.1 hypothetical protein [Paracraurococcus sp. LOR1-02]
MARGVRRVAVVLLLAASGGAWAAWAASDHRAEVTFPGERVYPESITATADGTLLVGSIVEGGVFRVRPGAATAERWIPPGAGDSMSTFGVLADERSGTLWVCSNDASALGVPPPGGRTKPVALKAFDLATGVPKASYTLPGDKTFCNDAAVAPDGTVYVTDSVQPHVLRLRPGAAALEVWAEHPSFGGGAILDGIEIGADGSVYVNTFTSGRLFRIAMGPDGKAGQVTELRTSQPLDHPDGMRRYGQDALLLAEGGGRFDIVHLDGGDNARVEVVKDGYKGPVSVVQVGDVAWILEGQQSTLFGPKAGGKPGPFRAYAVPLPARQ